MANKSSSDKKKKKKKSSSGGSVWSLNKVSFYTLCAVAILYLVAMILSLCGISLKIVGALQGVATAVVICIAAVNAWRFVKNKPVVWKVLYIIVLLVVLIGIVIPLVV